MDSNTRFAVFAVGALCVACVVAAAIGIAEGPPPLVAFLVFLGLLMYGSHRSVEISPDVEISAVFIILMASVVAFGDGHMFVPMVLGMAVTVRFDLLKTRRFRIQACFNAANLGFAMLAAVVVYQLVDPTRFLPSLTTTALSSLVMTAATVGGLAVAFWIEGDAKSRHQLVYEFGPACAQNLPFAVLGYAIGQLYLDLGVGVMLLVIVPILIAREMFASYLKVKESHDETVHMLVRALEAKDRYTSGHSERVAQYAQYMGEAMSFGPARMERLRFAALMHDIGKLVVPNHLLNKPDKLTEAEFARIRIHEKVSVQMLSHIDFLRPIAAATHSDHMRFDPDDPDHPIEPYIVMIADAYDAMTSTRSYRKALPQSVAFQELRDKAGIQFHPACVEALIEAIERRGERHGAGYEVQHEFDDAPEVGLGSAGLGDLLPSEA
jgi:hypothetical protein